MIKKVPIQWFVERFICDICISAHNRSYYLIKIGEEIRPRGVAAILECPRCRTRMEVFGYLSPQWEELAVDEGWPAHLPYVTGGKGGPAVEPPKPDNLPKPIPSYMVPPGVQTSPNPPENPPRMPQDRSEQAGLGGMVGEKPGIPKDMPGADYVRELRREYHKGMIAGLFLTEPRITDEEINAGKVGATGGRGGDKDTPNPDYFTPEDNTITGGGFMGRYEYVEIQKEGKPVRFWRESTGGIPPTQ